MSETLNGIIAWMQAKPGQKKARPTRAAMASPEAVLTGPDLVDRIVQAIALDQSVLLTGPRGCGKSRSISDAIERAGELEILPKQSRVFLQGNREIPRDYLAEDEIAFKTSSSGGKLEVIPDLRSAPLFAFARRDPATRQLIKKAGNRSIAEVEWDLSTSDGAPQRFVLFLDEINRFSDGVLDSLLSVLEERTAVLGGQEYRVPVVVCMTMNPPGYDGSARRLSPPLAARIGRSFRLSTPDLDTLTDTILPDRLARARELHDAAVGSAMAFPEVPPHLYRCAALVTLCMWGDFTVKKQGGEYLTPATHELLSWAAGADSQVRTAMRKIGELCQFGPDGRALGDWTIAAIGAAKQEASVAGNRTPEVEARHFLDTAIESVAHKVYDNFSPASRPDLTIEKEAAIRILAQRVMTRRVFEHRVVRSVDDAKFWSRPQWRAVFLQHGVTDPAAIEGLLDALTEIERYAAGADPATDGAADERIAGILIDAGVAQRSPEGVGVVFKSSSYQRLSRAALRLMTLSAPWQQYLDGAYRRWSLERNALINELKTVEPFTEYIDITSFLATCDRHNLDGKERRALAGVIETLWNLNVDTGGDLSEAAQRGAAELSGFAARSPAAEQSLTETLQKLYERVAALTDKANVKPGYFVRFLQRFRSREEDPVLISLQFQADLLAKLLAKTPHEES